MLRKQLTQDLSDLVSTNHSLYRYLVNLTKDQPYTDRSWLYDGLNGNPGLEPDMALAKVINMLNKHGYELGFSYPLILGSSKEDYSINERAESDLEADRLSPQQTQFFQVIKLELSQVSKYGPQGGHESMDELFESVVSPTYNPDAELVSLAQETFASDDWQKAKEMALQSLLKNNVSGLRPASIEYVVMDMADRDVLISNSGIPDFARRKSPEVLAKAKADAKSGKWKEYPAILLFRRYNGKTRPVWMYPESANIAEGRFYQPLFSAIKKSQNLIEGFFVPWKGWESTLQLISKRYGAGATLAASDFSSTDAHFQKYVTVEVADVLEQCFKEEYRAEFRENLMHMHEIPLIIGPNDMLSGDHGVSSGSNWTNFIETIFDYILGFYAQIKSGDKVKALYAIGDDIAWEIEWEDKEEFKQWLEDLGKSVGQEIKAEKTTAASDRIKTLQRLVMRDYSTRDDGLLNGIYPIVRALKSSIFPERFHLNWNKDLFCLRQFAILENCVDHPCFKEFLEFVMHGNLHLLPFVQYTDRKVNQLQADARRSTNLIDSYNQEKRDEKISTYRSLGIARALSDAK